MIAEFSIVPLGEGSSIGAQVAKTLDIVDKSGLPYKINPMGTVLEGEWDDVMDTIKVCHAAMMKHSTRALTMIKIDDRKGQTRMIEQKVESVEKRLGRKLKK